MSVRIEVAGMGDVVRGLEEGVETLTEARSSLRSTMNRFGVASERAAGMGPAVDWARAELPGVRRRLARAEALENSRPTWPAGVVFFDEGDISSMDPAAAGRAGREAATELRDGRGVPDAALIDLIVQMQDDPYFASGFAKALSAQELAEVMIRLSGARTPMDGTYDYETVQERNAWYGRLLGGMSTTLGTATRATGDLALPAGYADAWVAVITEPVRTMHGLGPDGEGLPDQANALGVLLTAGRFSPDFLRTVSEGVYEYEREFQAEFGGAVWRPRASDTTYSQGVVDADGTRFMDPMAGIMIALSRDPLAAQGFFSGGRQTTVEINGQDLQVPERLQYLIQERTWAVDATNGAALGSALEAATTVLRDRGTTGRTSAEIASQTFALIGQQTGVGADRGFLGTGLGADDGWKMWAGMRPHVAQMLASYGADVHRAVIVDSDDLADAWSNRSSGAHFPADMPHGAMIDKELLARIVATLGEDQESFTIFLTGVMQANNLAVGTGLQRAASGENGDQAIADFLRGIKGDHSSPAVTNSGILLGWALDTGYGGARADEAMQRQQMEAVADALSFTSALPFVPKIESAWLGWGADQVQDRTLDAIRGSAPSDATATYAELDEQAREDLRNTTMDLLLQNGYFDDTTLAGIAPPPESVIVRSPTGDPLYFLSDSRAYREWVTTSSLQSVLAESVIGVYADQWGSVR